jgi:hypothetical protein
LRRPALLLAAALGAAVMSTPAHASTTCQDLGPLPGWGPVCAVECQSTISPRVNPKNLGDTLRSLIVNCPA